MKKLCGIIDKKINTSIKQPAKEVNNLGNTSNGDKIVIKKGKYGLYANVGNISHSLKHLGNRPVENITIEDITKILEEKNTTTNIIRVLNESISIRKGAKGKGDYIYFKTLKMEIKTPFNLNEWIENNRHLLKPPVGNKNLYIDSGDYIVMIVAGPNARKDYHYNETEELFYQIEGDIIVKTQQEGKLVEYKINENEMFLLPAKVPHSPIRSEGSIGLVIERKRSKEHKDGLMWFSDTANELLYEEYFQLTNIEKDFLAVFKRFYSNEKLRTCPKTGELWKWTKDI